MSAELKVIQGERTETLTEATARRFREQLAGRNITRRDVARAIGKSDPWIGRRAAGQLPFDTDELQAIENATGISAAYLLTGVNEESRRPVGPDGGSSGVVHPPGLEPGTH
ncbi:helix-turn-helix domain-containing protein [Brevibacterium gallinarum]|uniref:Helix-turn-helix transcriptional regulator n=1 Tax=Brevibacterium gallinarum TaxID=2762220 RepID=A0ABR8WR33_9MICO|nr:helix-turn-helix transcriptional regulator [Brevibacterium gallinarum]MBD8019347.1 helix-turn-helix transcriptional regulator [Brevibacterium gallinarum]